MRRLIGAALLAASFLFSPVAAQAQDNCEPAKSEHVFSQTPNGPLKLHFFHRPALKASLPRQS